MEFRSRSGPFRASRFRTGRMGSAVRTRVLCLALAGTVAFVCPPGARAQDGDRLESRVALVVGNTDYDSLIDLPNARRDADLVAEYLADLGFRTITVQDGDFDALQTAVADVAAMSDEGAKVVFYFAGHGLQVGASNYLLPVDSRIDGLHDLPFASLSLNHVMSILSARAETALFILDSCRDNPFLSTIVSDGLDGTRRSIEAGFFFERNPIDTFIAFSTSPGELAADGPEGGNSPFTQALVANARGNPGAEMSTLMARTRRDVFVATEGRQVPWQSSSLTAPLVLGEARAASFPVAALPELTDSVTRGAAAEPITVYVSDRFEREVPVGQRILDTLGINAPRDLLLETEPDNGSIAMVEGGRIQVLGAGDPVPGGALESLMFLPDITRFSSVGLESLAREAQFSLTGAQPVTVDLRLVFEPCDLLAGDVLDPGGVGPELYRYEFRPQAALRACRAAVEAAPDNGRLRYQLARALMGVGDLEGARAELVAATERGHVRAAQRMALLILAVEMQREGLSQRPMSDESKLFLEVGIDLGDPLADYSMGRDLLRYAETPLQRDRGYNLLMRAFSAGYLEAINELGRYFLQDDSPHQDSDRALRYFTATAERNNINGDFSLGLVYLRGMGGITPSPEQALVHLQTAAEGGHPSAPNTLGVMFETGEGVAADPGRAVEWYDMALDRGWAWGGTNAAYVIIEQSPAGYSQFDAALRAGRSAALEGGRAADDARDLLGRLPDAALTGAAQSLLNEMGADLTVDGAFGPASVAALQEALGPAAQGLSPASPLDLLIGVARAHWAENGFRIDML